MAAHGDAAAILALEWVQGFVLILSLMRCSPFRTFEWKYGESFRGVWRTPTVWLEATVKPRTADEMWWQNLANRMVNPGLFGANLLVSLHWEILVVFEVHSNISGSAVQLLAPHREAENYAVWIFCVPDLRTTKGNDKKSAISTEALPLVALAWPPYRSWLYDCSMCKAK